MSKELGQKIAIKFTQDLVGDVSGMTPNPVSWEMKKANGVASCSNQYSTTYSADKAFDGNTSTFWRTNGVAPQWIKIQFPTTTWVNGFRWYVGSSYRPNAFVLEGSNDDENWTNILEAAGDNLTGWKSFNFIAGSYTFLRWTINSYFSSYLYLYEIEISVGYGNTKAFTVTGREYNYEPYGALETKEYIPEKIEPHPTMGKSIILTFPDLNRFNNVEGNISISYDATKGSLAGTGGPVESFTQEFTPEGLLKKPNPHNRENIEISEITGTGNLIRIYYTDSKSDERIEITDITAVGTLTHVNDL